MLRKWIQKIKLNQTKLIQQPKWVFVYHAKNQIDFSLMKSFLESNEIPVLVNNKLDSSYNMGYIEVYVPFQLENKAKQLITEFNV